jgi:hypothetical protein
MNQNTRNLIIIPALNEEKNLPIVVNSIRESCPDFHIVVIDDGSTDNTKAVAERLGCDVVSLPFNLGIGAAVQTGFLFAKEHGYDIAVQVDADGQHLPEEIGKLIEPIRKDELDVVIGSRYVTTTNYDTPFFRRLGMIILSAVNSLILGKKVTDTTSGFRAYNRKAIHFLAENYPDDYPEPEAIVLLARNGFRIGEVAVSMRKRVTGSSSITPVRSIYYMIKVLLAIFVDIFRKKEIREEHGN